jgi:hypothetical protein
MTAFNEMNISYSDICCRILLDETQPRFQGHLQRRRELMKPTPLLGALLSWIVSQSPCVIYWWERVSKTKKYVWRNDRKGVLKCLSFNSLLDAIRKGNLFTLFLHNPLVAFLYICNIANVQVELWEQCCQQLRGFEGEWVRLFTKLSKVIGKNMIISLWIHK